MTIIQALCYGAGSVCLGIALTFGLLTTLSARYHDVDKGEGCLSAAAVLLPLTLGLYLILKAVTT
jgi:hypothetical protein